MTAMTAMTMATAINAAMPTSTGTSNGLPPLPGAPGFNTSAMGALNDMMGDMDMSCKISVSFLPCCHSILIEI